LKIFITGGAGFIGSHLVDELISKKNKVTVYDNFSTGRSRFLSSLKKSTNLNIIKADLLDHDKVVDSMKGHDFVFHFAANADVRFGIEHPKRDLEQNIIVTHNVLEAMRINKISKIVFSSTGSIYGEALTIPTPEDVSFPVQTSLYGASKLSGEGMISAYCEGFQFQAWIFRFVSILGERYSHGHIFDFYKQLNSTPNKLKVLGDGSQRKSYLYVKDCINGILHAIQNCNKKLNIFNLGTNEYVTVNESISIICKELDLNPELIYTGGDRGWVGDNPFIWLDCKNINSLGWKPKLSIAESVRRTVQWIKKNEWIIE
tara:strand:- start:16334 stop:17281 length:948 start_codon:yes stop_codon:yes gene_type:complete